MKQINLIRKIAVVIGMLSVFALLFSCDIVYMNGGVIRITNNTDTELTVTIKDSKEKVHYENIIIAAGGIQPTYKDFAFEKEGTYIVDINGKTQTVKIIDADSPFSGKTSHIEIFVSK